MTQPTEETFHYSEAWLKDIFCQDGQFRIDSFLIAGVLGAGWLSPWDIWNSIQTALPSQLLRKAWGKRLEWTPFLRKLYEERTQRNVNLAWRRIHHKEYKWCTASILGLTEDPLNHEEGGLLFTVSTQPEAWTADGTTIQNWTRVLPPDIAMEAYWMMFCSELPWVDIVVGLPSPTSILEMRIIRILKDEKLQRNLFRATQAWREHHLVHKQIPDIDGSKACASFLLDRFAYGTTELRTATPEEENVLEQYSDTMFQMRELEARQQLLRNELIRQIGHFGGLERSDGGVAIVARNPNGLQLQLKKASKAS